MMRDGELAALWQIARAVADLPELGNDLCACRFNEDDPRVKLSVEDWIAAGKPHTPRCIYAQARALVARQEEQHLDG